MILPVCLSNAQLIGLDQIFSFTLWVAHSAIQYPTLDWRIYLSQTSVGTCGIFILGLLVNIGGPLWYSLHRTKFSHQILKKTIV